MKRYGWVMALLALVGCQSKPLEQMSYTERNQFARTVAERCVSQGVPAGGAQMEDCLRQEIGRESSIRAENRDRRQAMAAALGDGMSEMGASMQQSAAASRPTTCSSNVAATYNGRPTHVTTTCY